MDEKLTPEQQDILDSIMSEDDEQDGANYRWDEDFQRTIIGLLVNDKTFLLTGNSLIKASYFTNETHRIVCSILFEHLDAYKMQPNRFQLVQEFKDRIQDKDDKIKFYHLQELTTVLDYYVPGLDTREYLTDKITNFAKIQAMKYAFNQSLTTIKKAPESDETWARVHDILREAMTVDRSFDHGLDYFQTVEERYQRMQEKLEKGECFSTSFAKIDEALVGGGLGRGEIGSVIANSGVGKSLFLVGASVVNVCNGKRVLYVSTEMDQDKVAERFDAQIANVPIGALQDKKDIVKSALEDETKDYEDKRLLLIKQFPAGDLDVATLQAYYQQITLWGFKPDLIVLDYVGEMKDMPGMPTWESRYRIVRDLRGFATQEDVCILTAMQPNRSGREAQDNTKLGSGVIDDDNLADAYGQIRPLDACWSINQMQDEKSCDIARIFVIKHRHGKSRFITHIQYDMETLRLNQIGEGEYTKIYKSYQNTRQERTAGELGDEMTGGNILGGKKVEFKDSYDEDDDDGNDDKDGGSPVPVG